MTSGRMRCISIHHRHRCRPRHGRRRNRTGSVGRRGVGRPGRSPTGCSMRRTREGRHHDHGHRPEPRGHVRHGRHGAAGRAGPLDHGQQRCRRWPRAAGGSRPPRASAWTAVHLGLPVAERARHALIRAESSRVIGPNAFKHQFGSGKSCPLCSLEVAYRRLTRRARHGSRAPRTRGRKWRCHILSLLSSAGGGQ